MIGSRKSIVFTIFLLLLFSSPVQLWSVDLREAIEQVASQLMKSVPEGQALRVAVTDFPDLQGVTSNLGRYVAERLTTRMSAQPDKFRVIERRRLTQVLEELRFGMFDLVDPTKAKQLGKMLGVEAIVVGTLSDLGTVVDVDARIIEIETSNSLPGVSATISKDQVVAGMMSEGQVAPVARVSTDVPRSSFANEASLSVKPSEKTSTALRTFKDTTTSLVKRAKECNCGTSYAKGLIDEYNLVVQKIKAIGNEDPFVTTLEELKGWNDSFAEAGAVAGLASGLESYLGSFTANEALKVSSAYLAVRAKECNCGSVMSQELVDEYNILVRQTKTVFPQNRLAQTLKKLEYRTDSFASAAAVATLARELEAILMTLGAR